MPKPKTNAERVKAHRQRKLAAGLVQFGPVWVSPALKVKLQKLAKSETKK